MGEERIPHYYTPLLHHFERDALGRLIRKRTDDGVTKYTYDNLLSIRFTDNQGEQQRLDYSYDAVGQLLSETNSAGELKYAYDELGNLQTLTLPDQRQLNHLYYGSGHLHQINLGPSIESLNYDAAGNLFDGYRVNGLIKHNRVHVYQDKRYRYDRFGRLSEKRIGSNRIQRFEYDAEHRLICIRQQQGSMAQRIVFGYDPLGRRISKQVYNDDASEPSHRTQFHWQGLRLLEEVQDGRPSLYVYANPDSYEPLARVDGKPGSETILYFHTNLAGLPEQLTDTDGNTVWHSEYQAWGRTRDEWQDRQAGSEQNLRFQGQYLDRETGLHYNTFRFFDPDVGRFTQPDPIGLAGGLNLYQYAPNPIGWIDPWGLNPVTFTDSQGLTLKTYGYTDLSHLSESKLKETIFMNGPNAPHPWGLSPVDKQGEKIVLHHHRQQTEGPIIAMPEKHHGSKINGAGQHPKGNKKGSGISNRKEFNFWKREFWVSQAQKALDRKPQGISNNGACEL